MNSLLNLLSKIMHTKQDAFAALRYRDFTIITINQLCLTLGILIQEVIVGYSLYQIARPADPRDDRSSGSNPIYYPVFMGWLFC